MRGGPADGITLRLYPHNDGWEELLFGGSLYIAPDEQDRRKPFMVYAKNLER